MGRVNKRIQAAKKAKIVKSAPANASPVMNKKSTPLLLDKPTLKSIKKHASFKVITKKDKLNIKKKHLHQKLTKMEKEKKELKEAARRKKKAITGDLKPIQDTLKDILDETEPKEVKVPAKKKGGQSRKQKKLQAQMQKDLSIFSQVLAHPEYAKDPFNTITTHIENKMLMEAMQQE